MEIEAARPLKISVSAGSAKRHGRLAVAPEESLSRVFGLYSGRFLIPLKWFS
jgi:hypothetical protein